ncbi:MULTISPECIES: porin [Burkholderiaceae]|uniref:porin n=1 Tax=Burkholderiaceae TaxID=119060 RepID=UPI0009664CF5|nr:MULTISPECIES: porin [Burkholderiaceae]MCG1039803.1 porin [Mycetohabitans sp. B7]SIT70983.1 Outer membrane protein (porin) [Burkholderia sp. b14]
MKTPLKLAPFVLFGAIAIQAHAQSSVTLYGLISAGIGFATNQSGKPAWQALSGTNQNPRWGLKGTEDLGQGLSAIFQLENGFNVMTGSAAQNGRFFGRQAYVGLADRQYGSLTFGRQYDAIHDYIGPVIIASNGVNIGDNDNGYNDIRVQNSVKYVSPVYYGLKLTAQYGFSNANGFTNNNAYSFGLGYERGALRWSVVYAQYNQPYSATNADGAIANDYASPLLIFSKSATAPSVYASRQRIAGTGGFYTIGRAQFAALFTDVRYDYLDNSHLHLQNFGLNVVYAMTPAFFLGAAYGFTNGKYDVVNKQPKWHQVNLQADYFLSKRTDVALTVIAQQAAGDADHAQIFAYNRSTGIRQLTATLGMRHVF